MPALPAENVAKVGANGLKFAERLERVEASGADGGSESGERSCREKHGAREQDRPGVEGRNRIEQIREKTGNKAEGREAGRQANRSEEKRAANDKTEDVGWLCTESDANADFEGAASDHLGKCGIEADGGEEKSRERERGEELGLEARVGGGKGDAIVEGTQVEERDVGIQSGNSTVNGGNVRVRIAGDAENDSLGPVVGLFERQVEAGLRGLREIAAANRADHADDFKPGMSRIVVEERTNGFADGLGIRKEPANKIGVDNDDTLRVGGVVIRKGASTEKRDAHGFEIARLNDGELGTNRARRIVGCAR